MDPRSAAPRMEASEDAAGATADAADASADAADAGGAEAARPPLGLRDARRRRPGCEARLRRMAIQS